MNLSDFIPHYRNAKRQMEATLAQDALQTAADIKAQVNLRVTERGEDAEGARFSEYGEQWKRDRQRRGRRTDRKVYYDHGHRVASVHEEITSQKQGEVTVSIKHRGNDNEMKARGAYATEKRKRNASDRAANILSPSDKEIDNATKAFTERRERRLEQLLNK